MRVDLPEPIPTQKLPDLNTASPGAKQAKAAAGEFLYTRYMMTDGPSRGVELLVIDSGTLRAAICPTRGMSLWKANLDGMPVGWNSPVEGPIHPSLVPLTESGGIGWLDGFDELLVRCGLRSFGAPDFAPDGQLRFPLHGRVGNLPARNVRIDLDEAHSLLHVQGEVHETRFLQYNLRLEVKYTFAIGEPKIAIHDVVTNAGGTPTTMQILYHINIGAPILGGGATLHLGAQQVVARNAHAASGLADWPTYLPPTAGYAEQVYFFEGRADSAGWAKAMLAASNADRGFVVHYRTDTLPYFTQWKNTVAESDGYVTGLEPGTGFPNPRSFEEQQGRLVELGPGKSTEFALALEVIDSSERLTNLRQELQSQAPTSTSPFNPAWCVAET